jgi:hypothetical protein
MRFTRTAHDERRAWHASGRRLARLLHVVVFATPAVLVTALLSPVATPERQAPRPEVRQRTRAAVVNGGLAIGFGTLGLGLAAVRGWQARCPEWESLGDCEVDLYDLFYATMQTAANLHALAFAGAASGILARRARDSRRTRIRLVAYGAAALSLGAMLGATSYALVLVEPPGSTVGTSKLIAGRAILGELAAAVAITGTVMLARVVAQRRVDRRVERRVHVGVMPSRGGALVSIGGGF